MRYAGPLVLGLVVLCACAGCATGTLGAVFLDARLRQVYVAVGDPGVIDVFDAEGLRRLAIVKTEPGAHTLGFDAERSVVYAFLPQSSAAAVYRADR